ncbi:TetR/AcrR family transcriptional regulator [Marinovum sp.]|uniref:TetR/AcrR family transcriptional regulator n=1 Tax=Marinovum sp. TaxID=2024839 RepID=UPI002B26E70B|nr:TetR/AcrR family transcriptional regulator [Marinovum sp.]
MADTSVTTDQGRSEPDTRKDTNLRRELVREELLDNAALMFDEHGFDRVSMAMIARQVGLGRSAIYHYFASKDDILATLVEAEAMAPVGRIREIAGDDSRSTADRLMQVVRDGVVRRLSSGSRFVRLARLEAQIPDHMRKDYDKSRRAIYDEHVTLIEKGIARGEFRPTNSHVAAFGIIGMANWTSRWFRADGSLSAQEVADIIADLALASLRVPESTDERLGQLQARLNEVAGELSSLADSIGPAPTAKG